MGTEIGKSCFDRDKPWENHVADPHFEEMTDRWHPAVRLLIIVGGAASLWAMLLALVV